MKYFKRGIYSQIFFNVILSVIASVILISAVLYSNYKNMILKYEYQSKADELESKKAQVSRLSNIALNIGNQIFLDVNVNKLLYYKNPDIFDMSTAFNQLRIYRVTIPYIESIYVYNKLNDYIYVDAGSDYSELTVNGYKKQEEGFLDSSANEIIEHFKDYKPFCPIARVYQNKVNGVTTNNYFYTFFIYASYTKEKKANCIFVNFKTDYFLSRSENTKNSEYFVVDKNGVIVSNTSKFEMMKNYSDKSYIKNIISNGDKDFYFTDEVNGKKMFFVYTKRDQYGWQYVSMSDYATLLCSVRRMQMNTILVSSIILGFGIVIAFAITKKIYYPINEMETNIKELKIEKRNANSILKRIYIAELLSNKEACNGEFIKRDFDKLNIQMDFTKNLAVVLIKIDNYKLLSERNESDMINAYKFAIINVLSEALQEEYKIDGTDMGDDEVLLLANINADADINHFAEKLQYARKIFIGYFNISFTIIISSIDQKADQLAHLYQQVTEASMHRVFYDNGSIILANQINQKQANEYEYPLSMEKQLVESMLTGKMGEAKDTLQNMLSNLNEYPIIIYNMVIARLVVTINNTVNVMNKNGVNNNYETFLLHKANSNSELMKQFSDFFESIDYELKKKKAGKQDDLAEQIGNIIRMRYTDPNFSVEAIADSLNKSMSYISRIYAQCSGITINDKINELRMIKAGQLLKDKNIPIGDIAGQVGFSSTSYFYKVFKKYNGVTPGEYQERMCK